METNRFNMDYENIYNRIIEKAKNENRKMKCGAYYEKHHIKPRSLFKELINDNNNIVLLTAKEHFICHMLLEKIYDCSQMRFAIWRMCNDSTYKVSSRYYSYIKEKIAKESSVLNKGRKLSEETKRKISLSNIGKRHSEETKKKMSASYDPSKHIVTDEQRKKYSELASKRFKGKKQTEEFKNHLSVMRSGSGNTMYGKCNRDYMTDKEYDEYKKHLSESLMGHAVSEETRRKIGEKTKERVQGGMNPRAVKVKIIEIDRIFDTISECASFLGVNRCTIKNNQKGNFSYVKGYTIEILS